MSRWIRSFALILTLALSIPAEVAEAQSKKCPTACCLGQYACMFNTGSARRMNGKKSWILYDGVFPGTRSDQKPCPISKYRAGQMVVDALAAWTSPGSNIPKDVFQGYGGNDFPGNAYRIEFHYHSAMPLLYADGGDPLVDALAECRADRALCSLWDGIIWVEADPGWQYGNVGWSTVDCNSECAADSINFKPVIMHELGHAYGLAHTMYGPIQGAVMDPEIAPGSGQPTSPATCELAAMKCLYDDNLEAGRLDKITLMRLPSGGVECKWTMLGEGNCSSFTIEKATPAGDIVVVAQAIPCGGDSGSYSVVDVDPTPTGSVYRIFMNLESVESARLVMMVGEAVIAAP